MTNVLIITGSAPCTLDDLRTVESQFLMPGRDYMAIGSDAVGLHGHPLSFVATYHPREIPAIRQKCPGQYHVVSHKMLPGVAIVIRHESPSGSSSLLGVLAGLHLGYRKIILCGCPLTGTNRFGKDYNKLFAAGWRAKYDRIKHHVRSMSGWTAELLGTPTQGWIDDDA